MATKIGTLQNTEKTEALLPRTCLKAVADKNGDYISEDVLASDINALKDGAVEALSTVETFTLDFANGYTPTIQTRCIKMGKFVEISCEFTFSSSTATNFSNCFTVPVGYRPNVNTACYCVDANNEVAMNCTIKTDGTPSMYRNVSTATTTIRLHALYIVV